MKKLFLMLVISVNQIHAADIYARVKVDVFGEPGTVSLEDETKSVQREIVKDLEAIDGIITVSKAPDFMLFVSVSRLSPDRGGLLVLSAIITQVIPAGAAGVMLSGAAGEDAIENVQKLLNALTTVTIPFATAGPETLLPSMCQEVTAFAKAVQLDGARKFHPGARDAETNYRNFLMRMGAREVRRE